MELFAVAFYLAAFCLLSMHMPGTLGGATGGMWLPTKPSHMVTKLGQESTKVDEDSPKQGHVRAKQGHVSVKQGHMSVKLSPNKSPSSNRCMKHFYVHTIHHPTLLCESKHVLLTRCEGVCAPSMAVPRITFGPLLHRPFRYRSDVCRDRLSVMKAVRMHCADQETPYVYATYRYIVECTCSPCKNK